jgi:hypothetical protein
LSIDALSETLANDVNTCATAREAIDYLYGKGVFAQRPSEARCWFARPQSQIGGMECCGR